ncbi:MAG TPA: CRISPR-associated protein [Ignavibacteria bacterium]|nr:CRISPR-associated protein [Ignavibacteria bacterium]
MLINFSNHLVKDWSDAQLEDARKIYKKLHDIPFPNVDPNADTEDILKLSEQYSSYISKLILKSEDKKNAVHVMGEHSLIFAVVSLLQKNDITCIVSTTERNSEINGNEKISKFNFVRFREYPKNV